MSAAARPKIALCSPAARPEAALLERHGYRVTASATATADVVMPARGGALAFVLHRAEAAPRLRAPGEERGRVRCVSFHVCPKL